ncbi:MAG: hypothetical protein QXR60_05150 [Candidatus Nanoarchaeia archaeon]
MKLRFFVFALALLVIPAVLAQDCTKEGGVNYYKVGTALVKGTEYTDMCIGDKRLLEYFCDNKGMLEYEYFDCEEACVDGACSEAGTMPSGEECVEDWECSEWSACVDGKQTRSCEDANDCGTTENLPALEQTCGEQPPVTPPVTTPTTSGFVKYRYYIIGGVIVVLIILYLLLRKKENKEKEPEKK